MNDLTHIEALSQLSQGGTPFVAVTVVEARGSTPQDVGAKMLVNNQGLVHGTVGGGKVEGRAIQLAQSMLADLNHQRELVDWNLQRDIGMTCGGVVKLFFEVYNRSGWRIVVFGAGHVAQALIRILLTLDCQIVCCDSRQAWLDQLPDEQRLKRICVDHLPAVVKQLEETDYVVCMTMGHATDRPVLSALFRSGLKPAYLGVIGSKNKRGTLLRELIDEGIAADVANGFRCPLGLPIGNNQPAEIAISIAAELLQRRAELESKRAETVISE